MLTACGYLPRSFGHPRPQPIFKKNFFNLIFYFWLSWVFLAVLKLSLVAMNEAFSMWWLLVAEHGL